VDAANSIGSQNGILRSFTHGWLCGLLAGTLKNWIRFQLHSLCERRTVRFHFRAVKICDDTGEQLFTNIIRVNVIPHILRVFRVAYSTGAEEWKSLQRLGLSTKSPRPHLCLDSAPPDFADRTSRSEQLLWTECGVIPDVLAARDIARELDHEVAARRLRKRMRGTSNPKLTEHSLSVFFFFFFFLGVFVFVFIFLKTFLNLENFLSVFRRRDEDLLSSGDSSRFRRAPVFAK